MSIKSKVTMMKSCLLLSIIAPAMCCATTDTRLGIHHGKRVTHTQFPYFVGLREKISGLYRCGGTLISKDTVLTAAHCVYDFSPTLIANIGMDRRRPLSAMESIEVKKAIIPAKYGIIDGSYDIALLKLKHAVTATHTYMKLKEWDVANNADVYSIGFGLTSEGGYSSYYLLGANFKIIDWYEHCSGHNYPKNYPPTNFDPHYHLCTQSYPDHGDSGGPVMNFHDGQFYQVGIVSISLLRGGQQTRVSAYYDWINAHK